MTKASVESITREDLQAMHKRIFHSAAGNLYIAVTGDFNEPSHLDWTPRAATAGRCPLAVNYPSTRALTDTGLRFERWSL